MDERAQLAWDIYFAGLVHMTMHPGYQKPGQIRPSLEDMATLADKMLEYRPLHRDRSCP